jgi:hypothetical protein
MMMDGDDLAEALYARMLWNTPLSPQHADLLMDRLDLRPGLRIADVGCGWGELLLRVVSRAAGPDKVHAMFFVVGPDANELARLAEMAGTGRLRPVISQTFPLAEGQKAFQSGSGPRRPGRRSSSFANPESAGLD